MKAASPLLIRPGKDTPLAFDGVRVPGQPRARRAGKLPAGRQRRPARLLPLRRGRERDAVHLAERGAEGAGGRRAVVRARERRQGQAVRPLLRRPQSGLPRGRGREAADDRGRARDRRAGRPLRRQARDDLLLLDLGREDRQRRRRVRDAGSVPPLASRPVGQGVAAPHVGARSCSALARSSRSSESTIASSTRSACRRRPVGCARSRSRPTRARRACRRACFGAASGSARPGSRSASFASISRARPSSSGRRSGSPASPGACPQPKIGASPDGSRWTEVGPFQRETSGVASARREAGTDAALPDRGRRRGVAGGSGRGRSARAAARAGPSLCRLTGTVRPRLSGATVFVERREGCRLEARREEDRRFRRCVSSRGAASG